MSIFDSTSPTARSTQLYQWHMSGGHCHVKAPDIRLDEHVHYYWLLTIAASSIELEIIPDLAIDLVLSPDIAAFATLFFPVDQRITLQLEGPVRYVGVSFRTAEVERLLGYDLQGLRDLSSSAVDLVDGLGIETLSDAIVPTTTLSSCARLLDEFLIGRLEGKCPSEASAFANIRCAEHSGQRLVDQRDVFSALEASVGQSGIAQVCKTLGVSERQFRRDSTELFGLSPKRIQRVLRLQAALREFLTCDDRQRFDLYYDDSHRIRELKRLTGLTPSEIRRLAEKYNSS